MRRTILTIILTIFGVRSIYALISLIIFVISLFTDNPIPLSEMIVDFIFIGIWVAYFIYAFLPDRLFEE